MVLVHLRPTFVECPSHSHDHLLKAYPQIKQGSDRESNFVLITTLPQKLQWVTSPPNFKLASPPNPVTYSAKKGTKLTPCTGQTVYGPGVYELHLLHLG